MRLIRRILPTFFPSLMVGVTLITSGIASAQKVAQKTARKDPVSVRLPPAAIAAMETISPDHIRWHVRYLSQSLPATTERICRRCRWSESRPSRKPSFPWYRSRVQPCT